MNPDELKTLQAEMKRLGIYQGDVDGKLGPQTQAALEVYRAREAKQRADSESTAAARAAQERADALEANRLALEAEKLRQTGQAGEVANAAETAKVARKAAYDADAQSGLGMATQTAAGAPAALTGVAAGRGMGMGINALMDRSQANKNATLAAAAQDRVAGLTTREGARTGTSLSGALPSKSPIARVGGRMLPHIGIGGFMAGKGAYMLDQEGEEDPFYPKMVNRAAGIGMLGAGTGLAERGLTYGISPGVPPDAKSIAIIESNQLRRNNAAPDAPAVSPKNALLAEAKAAGVPKAYKMTKGELQKALSKLPGMAGPLAAGALAYAMSPDDAQAADGSGGGNTSALTNAGLTAGAAYGARSAMRAAPVLGRALGPASAGLSLYENAGEGEQFRGSLPAEQRNTPGGVIASHAMPLAMRGASDIASIMSAPRRIRDVMSGRQEQGGSTMAGFEPPGEDAFARALADFESMMAEGAQQ